MFFKRSTPLKGAIGAVFVLAMGAMMPAGAQAPAGTAGNGPPKVAVVQFQSAVTATNEFQRDFAEVQKKFEPKRTALKNLQDEIDRLTRELQGAAATLSESEQASKARAIDSKKRQAQHLAEDSQTEYQHASEDLFNRVGAKLGKVLTKYAQDHGYTLVLDRSEEQDQTPAVLWASSSLDITQPVVDTFNAKSGVPAPGAAATPAARAPKAPR